MSCHQDWVQDGPAGQGEKACEGPLGLRQVCKDDRVVQGHEALRVLEHVTAWTQLEG